MLLTEILDSKANISWERTTEGFSGSFHVDGDEYQIQLDEYDAALSSGARSVVKLGFTMNGKSTLTNKFNSAKILGIILNSASAKIKTLNPDIVFFGAHHKNGSVDKRMQIYGRLANWYAKNNGYSYCQRSVNTSFAEYAIISKDELSGDDLAVVEAAAKSK